MAILPIIERELRVALRKQQPARRRFRLAALAVAGALLCLLLASVGSDRQVGRNLHGALCLAAGFLVLRTPQLTAGVFAEERRQQTLGLLFLSGLGAMEVFASKLCSAALVALTDLLVLFPMLALPFLMGGVSSELFLATVCGLPNILLFVLAVCLLASVLTRDDGTATILTGVLLCLLCGAGPLLYLAQSSFSSAGKASPVWLLLSPAYGPFLVWRSFGAASASEFWENFWITLAWSGLCVGAAATLLKSLWREREEGIGAVGWRARWGQWLHGEARERRRLAATWLEANPFVWLAARDRQPVVLAWSVVGGVVAVWLGCCAAWPHRWPSVPNLFLTATLLNLALRWIIRYTAARSLGEARRDGAYEFLLTTPLNPSDIVWGQFEALRWHFGPVTRAVLGLEGAMMLAGLALRSWTIMALAEYAIIWMVLLLWAWSQGRQWRASAFALWASVNCGRPAHAVWKTSGFNSWAWLWIFFNVRSQFSTFPSFPTGSLGEVILVSTVGLVVLLFVLGRWVFTSRDADRAGEKWEKRLIAEFREIVREPLPDPHDPRFKKWDARERFPWGWGLVQQQLHERLVRHQGGEVA